MKMPFKPIFLHMVTGLMARFRTGLKAGSAAGLLSVLLMVGHAEAIEVENLYEGRVIVESRSDERERDEAFGEALREVLIKVSGRRDFFGQNRISAALDQPQAYVDSWSYNSRQGPEGGSLIELRVSFAPESVQRLLSENDIGLWPSNRPLTLVWMVMENELGEREVIGQGESHPLLSVVREEMRQRGMPVLLPLMDLDDNRAIDTELLWDLQAEHIRTISLRYAVDSILVIRVFTALGSEYLGRSRYLFRDQSLERELYADSLAELVQPAVDQAADELAGYYSVLLSGTEAGVPISMQVDGVEDLQDYAALLQYVEGLTDVSGYSVTRVAGDRIELELSTGGQTRQLVESIALGRQLVAVSDPVRDDDSLFMHYRWAE